MRLNAKSISYQKLGRHRGSTRLWIEGRKLERAGIVPGQRFTMTWNQETGCVHLDFTAGDKGDRTVSKRMRGGREMPIVDISANSLEEALGEGIERAKITISPGSITVEIHPHDQASKERIQRLSERVASGEPLLTGSLAHGAGILDHAIHTGLEDQGVAARLAFAVEIDADILDAAASNNPIWDADTLQIQGGMQEAEAASLPKVDILVAGLPCTGASKAGKAKNHNPLTEDHPEAGALFVAFLRVVECTNPSVVILENVVDYAHSASAAVIRAAFTTWGYEVHETVLEGNAFGALEDRKRLCMVAVSPQLEIDLANLVPTRNKEETLGEILEDIDPESDLWKEYKYLVEKAIKDATKGSNFKPNVVGPEATKIGAIGAGYSKVRQTEAKVRHPSDPKKMRLLTPKEHAAVKTVPANLVENLGWTLAHTVLGNSVTWAAWRSVGRLLGDAANNLAEFESFTVDASALPEAVERIEFAFDERTPDQMKMF